MKIFFLAVLLLAFSSPLNAQDFSCPTPGTKLTTSNGNMLTFTDRAGMTCNYLNSSGEPSGFTAGVIAPRSPNATDFAAKFASLWPAAKGKEISFQTGNLLSLEYFYRIRGHERIKVPAGEFDVVVIDHEQRGIRDNNRFLAKFTFYWAPEVGYLVKYDVEQVRGAYRVAPKPWEAVSITK